MATATETETKKVNPKIDFMPHWKEQDQCFDEEEIEMVDTKSGRRIMKNGKPVLKTWPHDKPTAQISYENWLQKIVNPDTNEFLYCIEQGRQSNKRNGSQADYYPDYPVQKKRRN